MMTKQEIQQRIWEIEEDIRDLQREKDKLETTLDHEDGNDIIIGDYKCK